MEFQQTILLFARLFEALGVGALVVGGALSLAAFVAAFIRSRRVPRTSLAPAYRGLRRGLGRAILLGVELLVAADIIRSVAVAPTLQSVVVLAIIVLIRTFLSWSLELDITGHWPWQGRSAPVVKQPSEGDEE